jgi:hypothetical protein
VIALTCSEVRCPNRDGAARRKVEAPVVSGDWLATQRGRPSRPRRSRRRRWTQVRGRGRHGQADPARRTHSRASAEDGGPGPRGAVRLSVQAVQSACGTSTGVVPRPPRPRRQVPGACRLRRARRPVRLDQRARRRAYLAREARHLEPTSAKHNATSIVSPPQVHPPVPQGLGNRKRARRSWSRVKLPTPLSAGECVHLAASCASNRIPRPALVWGGRGRTEDYFVRSGTRGYGSIPPAMSPGAPWASSGHEWERAFHVGSIAAGRSIAVFA